MQEIETENKTGSRPEIFTIGHSNLSSVEFIHLLNSHGVKNLADVRRFPGSKKFPWFNQEAITDKLAESGIKYYHFEELGGRRSLQAETAHPEWRNPSFRAYADYKDTSEFTDAIKRLEEIARKNPTAIMCSEALWWNCHRGLISDHLKDYGWVVWHILNASRKEEHPYTVPGRQHVLKFK